MKNGSNSFVANFATVKFVAQRTVTMLMAMYARAMACPSPSLRAGRLAALLVVDDFGQMRLEIAQLVEPLHQALLGEGVDRKRRLLPRRQRHRLVGQVDRELQVLLRRGRRLRMRGGVDDD